MQDRTRRAPLPLPHDGTVVEWRVGPSLVPYAEAAAFIEARSSGSSSTRSTGDVS